MYCSERNKLFDDKLNIGSFLIYYNKLSKTVDEWTEKKRSKTQRKQFLLRKIELNKWIAFLFVKLLYASMCS